MPKLAALILKHDADAELRGLGNFKGTHPPFRPLSWGLAGMTISGSLATVAGWYVTEIGHQPFIVFGFIRVDEVASAVPAPMIALTLTLAHCVTVYLALIDAGLCGAGRL